MTGPYAKKPVGFISDWLHVQGVATPFLYVQGVALPFFTMARGSTTPFFQRPKINPVLHYGNSRQWRPSRLWSTTWRLFRKIVCTPSTDINTSVKLTQPRPSSCGSRWQNICARLMASWLWLWECWTVCQHTRRKLKCRSVCIILHIAKAWSLHSVCCCRENTKENSGLEFAASSIHCKTILNFLHILRKLMSFEVKSSVDYSC